MNKNIATWRGTTNIEPIQVHALGVYRLALWLAVASFPSLLSWLTIRIIWTKKRMKEAEERDMKLGEGGEKSPVS